MTKIIPLTVWFRCVRLLVVFVGGLLSDSISSLAAHLNFHLRKDSPAWKPGFKPIPLQSIGVCESDERASWPVVNEARNEQKDFTAKSYRHETRSFN